LGDGGERGCWQIRLCCLQHLGEVPFDGDIRRGAALEGPNDHPVNQRSRGIARLRVIAGGHGVAQTADLASVGLAQVRHEPERAWPGCGERAGQPLALVLQRRELGLQPRATQPVGDGLDKVSQLALDRG
jgi:hypothetical protein